MNKDDVIEYINALYYENIKLRQQLREKEQLLKEAYDLIQKQNYLVSGI